MQDVLQLLPVLLWLMLVLLFLVCVIGLVFSTRVFYVQARVAWWNRRAGSDSAHYPQWLLACASAIAAVVVFALVGGEPVALRIGLMGITAAITWIFFDWAARQFVAWAERKDAHTRLWRSMAQAAGATLRQISDPREIRPATARILRDALGARAVYLYMRGIEDFVPVHSEPSPPATPVVFGSQSLLVQELGRFPGPRSVVTAEDGRPAHWSKGSQVQLAVEQEQLRAIESHLVVPLVIDRAVTGFFLFGPKVDGGGYSSAEIRYVEAVTRQSTDRLYFAERAIRESDIRAEQMKREAAQQYAIAARRFLLPPEKPDFGPAELAAGWWGSERNRPLFYDIVTLPRRAAGLLLAEIDAPEEEAAVRLVQLQALVRSRFRAYDEDLAALLSSVRRALKWPEGVPPLRLFVARYTPDSPALTYVNAGFYPPILVRRSENGADLLRLQGLPVPLDSQNEAGWTEGLINLEAGDLVVIANEAVTRTSGAAGEPWGEGRLVDTLLGWEEQPIGDLVSLARRTIEEHEGPLAADAPSRLLMVMRVRAAQSRLVE